MFSPRTPSRKAAKPSPFFHSRNGQTSSSSGITPRRGVQTPRSQFPSASQSFHASQILEETPLHKIEAFGSPLPVLITEALTLSDRSTTEITACVDQSGWAWLVGARKLFVWRYRSSATTRAGQCKELTLPASDLAHSAERVCLIPSDNERQPAACIAVSPEGVVRYWPNIAFESSTAEISAELKGEECAQVINFPPFGCLLATTTSSLWLLEPLAGQASIQCKPLKASQGIFSGISRRVSSFIFGASQIQTNEAPLQAIVAAPENEYDDDEENAGSRSFYVLSDANLSKWQVPSIGPERLLYQMDARRVFKEALAKKVWEQDAIQLPQLRTWLLDVKLTGDGIVLLGAGVNQEVAQVMHYALVYFESGDEGQPVSTDFILLDYTHKFSDEAEEQLTSYKLMLPSEKTNTIFIYNSNSILMLQDKSTLDKMDLKTSGDSLLGAGCADGIAVFFSNTHGLFSVSAPKAEASFLDESNNKTMSMLKAEVTSMAMSMNHTAELTESGDSKSRLKAAFINYLNGNTEQAQELVEEVLFSDANDDQVMEVDDTVAALSQDVIDDYPNADPRWAQTRKHDSTSSTDSVIITQQLKDKQTAHNIFVGFLKKYGVWQQLGDASIRGTKMPTQLLLCEHVEKLEAAIALRELHAEHHKMVDWSIKQVLKRRRTSVPSILLPQDMFYREVSKLEDICPVLISFEKDQLATDQGGQSVVKLITSVNTILEAMLHFALKYRQNQMDLYSGVGDHIPEYIPWTATVSMRKIIKDQVDIVIQRGVSESRDVNVQGVLYQQVVGLSDILMDGYASQAKSLSTHPDKEADRARLEKEFERERHRLITPLLEHKQYERAASLAEKFEDFEMLMRICDATNNQDRLQRYRTQFEDKGFAQFLFNWYMKEGKRGHLLSQPMSQGDELSRFLDADNVKYLSWLHEIRMGNFNNAHQCLAELAKDEKNFLAKKKTLLSLSKLAALASDGADEMMDDNVEVINEELDLVLHQEQLPVETIESVGMDPSNMRVLSPEELIELYVSADNHTASEYEVKKALDLLRHVDAGNVDIENLRLHIWCRAILMDTWDDGSSQADPLESNRDKIFFKTVDLIYMDGGNLDIVLPSLKTLMSASELGDLRKHPNFKFLMQGGYEQIRTVLNTTDA